MGEPTKEELMARIAELEKQAGAKRGNRIEFKVSEKGGVSVYGLGRFPVTLYYEQWVRLLDSADALRLFLQENKSRLKLKGSDYFRHSTTSASPPSAPKGVGYALVPLRVGFFRRALLRYF